MLNTFKINLSIDLSEGRDSGHWGGCLIKKFLKGEEINTSFEYALKYKLTRKMPIF